MFGSNINREKLLLKFLVAFCLILIALVFTFIDPISQDLNYHNFADSREVLHVSNFWNVFSNLPFLLVGLLALYKMYSVKSLELLDEVKYSYFFLFIGVSLVAFGSAYYHLDPNNETLVWDRLPMTIAFMALFSLILSEFISVKLGKQLLAPLLLVGLGSIAYWYWGELNGSGDLRYYALVQFLPMIFIPIILYAFSSRFSDISGYWWLLLCYLLAKVFEHFDTEIYEILSVISGHSLKHIVSALGLYVLLKSFESRSIK